MLDKVRMSMHEEEIIIEIPDGRGEAYLYSTWPGLSLPGKSGEVVEGVISGKQIAIAPALQDELQLEMFYLQKEKLGAPVSKEYGPALLDEETSLVLRRYGWDPYWIEIETELPEWQERLQSHPQAILRKERKLGPHLSQIYLLPATLLTLHL